MCVTLHAHTAGLLNCKSTLFKLEGRQTDMALAGYSAAQFLAASRSPGHSRHHKSANGCEPIHYTPFALSVTKTQIRYEASHVPALFHQHIVAVHAHGLPTAFRSDGCAFRSDRCGAVAHRPSQGACQSKTSARMISIVLDILYAVVSKQYIPTCEIRSVLQQSDDIRSHRCLAARPSHSAPVRMVPSRRTYMPA
jgi:hypothetical protein